MCVQISGPKQIPHRRRVRDYANLCPARAAGGILGHTSFQGAALLKYIPSRFAAALVTGLILVTPAGGQDAPPKHDILKVLERFVGTWEDQITLKQSPWTPEAKTGTGTVVAKWALDGRFLELRSASKLDGTQGLTLMGHDMNTDSLRAWSFHSHGYNYIGTGTWDEKTRTINWSGELGQGMKMTSFDRFIDDDNREWQFVIKDDTGQVVFEIAGKSKRQKK
jgi:hypothetical protein